MNYESISCQQPRPYVAAAINVAIHVLILFTILAVFFMVYISGLTESLLRHEIDDAIEKLGEVLTGKARELTTIPKIQNNIKSAENEKFMSMVHESHDIATFGNMFGMNEGRVMDTENDFRGMDEESIIDALNGQVSEGTQFATSNIRSQLASVLNSDTLNRLKKSYSTPDPVVTKNNNWLFGSIILTNIALLVLVTIVILSVKYQCGQCVPIGHILLVNLVTFTFIGCVEVLFFTKVAIKYLPVKPSAITQTFFDSLRQNL